MRRAHLPPLGGLELGRMVPRGATLGCWAAAALRLCLPRWPACLRCRFSRAFLPRAPPGFTAGRGLKTVDVMPLCWPYCLSS